MTDYRKNVLFSALFLLIAGLYLSSWYVQTINAQTKPLTYPEIITALKTDDKKFPIKTVDGVWKNKGDLINWLIEQIKQRKVDKALTNDLDEFLRQNGATDFLIIAIRANSPLQLSELEKIKFIPFRKGDKFGFVDEKKRVLIPFDYDYVEPFFDGIAIVGKWGKQFINKANKTLYSSNSDLLENAGEGVGFIWQDKDENKSCKLVAVDVEGATLFTKSLNDKCTSIGMENYENGYAAIKDKSGWQTIDKKGNTIYSGKYSEGILIFSEEKEGKELYGLKSITGQIIIPPVYEKIGSFSEGLAAFSTGYRQWGFLDKTGKEVIPAIYDTDSNEGEPFMEGFTSMKYKGIPLIIDKTEEGFIPTPDGAIVVDIAKIEKRSSEDLRPFRRAVAEKSEIVFKYGFIDSANNEVIPALYEYVRPFSDGLAGVFTKEKCGFIDKTGNIIIPLKYERASSFSEGFARVETDTGEIAIDNKGNEITDKLAFWKVAFIGIFNEGLIQVLDTKSRLSGFIDKSGKEVIPLVYQEVKPFENGLACVKNTSKKWGVIDKSNKVVIPFQFDSAESIAPGVFQVTLPKENNFNKDFIIDDNKTLLDKNGRQLSSFSDLGYFFDGVAPAYLGEKYVTETIAGFLDKTGRLIKQVKYIGNGLGYPTGFYLVQKDKKDFYIDKNGTEYYEP